MDNENGIIYNIAREYVKRKLTNNLGKVVEEEDRLVCYVNKNKCEKSIFTYTIACFGIDSKNSKLADTYKLNKPIYYVLDGIDFDKRKVDIYGYDECHVIIKNCKFNYGIFVSINGECLLECSYIRPIHRLSIGANDLTIKNIDIQNELKYTGGLDIGIGADNQLYIIDSNLGRLNEKTNVSIMSGSVLVFVDSKIDGDNVECMADNVLLMNSSRFLGNDVKSHAKNLIVHGDSLINAKKEINIEASSLYPIRVISPFITFNDKSIDSNNELLELKEVIDPLSLKRLDLIQLLKNIRDSVEKNNLNEINKLKNELANRPIIKSYRKFM